MTPEPGAYALFREWLDRAAESLGPHDLNFPNGKTIHAAGDPYGVRLVAMLRNILEGHEPTQVATSGGSLGTRDYTTRCQCNRNSPIGRFPCSTVAAVLAVDLRTACHCGEPADGHVDGYCRSCSDVRCDAYPDQCWTAGRCPTCSAPEAALGCRNCAIRLAVADKERA